MNRLSLMLLVFGSLVCSAMAATMCDADSMDLCEVAYSCDADAMDLCADDDITSTTSPVVTGTATASASVSTKIGSFSVTVDATAPQVKASTEKAMGKLLYDQGVGGSAIEAAGYVVAVVRTARRLSEFSRQLAATAYVVTYTITVPSTAGVDAKMDATLNAIKSDPTVLQTEMVTQFAAANVATATTVTVASFAVQTEGALDDTDAAPRLTGDFSTTLLVLLSCFTSTQFVFAASLS